MNNSDRQRVAIKQVAHAVLHEMLGTGEVITITIVPSSKALGFVSFDQAKEHVATSEEIENSIIVSMAGIASRDLIEPARDSGDASSLERARFMAEKLADIESIGWRQTQPDLANTIISRCHDRAKILVTRHKDRILKVADVLVKEGTISGAQLAAL